MDILERAEEFKKRKMSSMTTSDRVSASREAKVLVLELNEIFKKEKDPDIMDIMKRLSTKKKKIDKRLKGNLNV